jgi:DNA-binding NarL/FixJ family response regulator
MNTVPSTVLVIEAHPIMREALCAAIADESDLKVGMQAATVAETLEMATRMIPDIILLALDHSDDSELYALTILHTALPATPILALTSNEAPGQEQAALAHGAQTVLTKAAPRAALIHALRKLRALQLKQVMNHIDVNLNGRQNKNNSQ